VIPLLTLGVFFAVLLRPDRLFQAGWGPGQSIALAIGLVPAALVLVATFRQMVLPRVTFDRGMGLLTLGWRGLRGQRPLASVIGVQIMQTRKRFGGPELDGAAVTMYQLNLILDDPAERRLNVMTSNPLTARANARAVAEFLGVPVLDSADPPADAAAASAPGATPLPLQTQWAVPSPVVIEPDPDILLIRPRRLVFLSVTRSMWHGVLLSVLLLGSLAARGAGADWISIFLLVSIAATLVSMALLLIQSLGRRVRFDRAQGVLTLGRRASRPLASVTAVQIVDRTECQLNLLLDDAGQTRLNLITDTEAAVVRKAAERVASFLDVPLLEAPRPGPATAQAGAGEAVNYLEELKRSPLPAGRASIRGPARIVPRGDDVLVLRARSLVRWNRLGLALLMIGPAIFLAWFAWFGPAPRPAGLGQLAGWLPLLLLASASLFAALKPLLLYRDHFDQQAGRLTLGWFGLKGAHALAKVLAVQLIPGGLVDKGAGSFGRGGERVSYQMNLVMADVYQDRLNLTDDSDLVWTRQAGQQVADFLDVPLIDQIAEG
jgi:hypothetical protein